MRQSSTHYNQNIAVNYFKKVVCLLKREGFKADKFLLSTSLNTDLKFHQNDFYFLKLDIEEMTLSEVDLDEIYACTYVTDVVNLLMAKDKTLPNAIR